MNLFLILRFYFQVLGKILFLLALICGGIMLISSFLYYYMDKSLIEIGSIVFSTTGIHKKIADQMIFYGYREIENLSIEKILPYLFFEKKANDAKVYLLRIRFFKQQEVKLFVSEKKSTAYTLPERISMINKRCKTQP
jgi:hypothetical protein